MDKYKESLEKLLKASSDRRDFSNKLYEPVVSDANYKICFQDEVWWHSLIGEQLLCQKEIEELTNEGYVKWVSENTSYVVGVCEKIRDNNLSSAMFESFITIRLGH